VSHSSPDPDSSPADAVRADIEATRAELAETVDALHDKLDVKAQASEKVSEAKQKVSEGAARAKAAAPEPVQHALDRVGEKAGPMGRQLSEQAAPHRGKIIAGVVAVAVALFVVRKRRSGES
jgi:F0F1-type ATP synthase membrane subunit b/b'